MSDVTQVLHAIEQGDPSVAEQLLPLVYDELRKLAAAKMAQEKPGQTLDATALVDEAYLRLAASPGRESGAIHFADRRHFFRVSAEAKRRILIDQGRQKRRLRHGGERERVPMSEAEPAAAAPSEDCWPWTKPLNASPPLIPPRQSWSSFATSPGCRETRRRLR
jgi:RNA polymerase sigma factor (TIGR02999 family)